MATLAVKAPFAKFGLYPINGDKLGEEHDLDPDTTYTILLPPPILRSAAPSFRAVPITDDAHAATGWIDFDPSTVIGCTGPEVEYRAGRLWAEVKFWHPRAIEMIKAGTRRHLSMGFLARYEMKAGEFRGEPFDGYFTHLQGDHVALVEEGQAGDDCALPVYR